MHEDFTRPAAADPLVGDTFALTPPFNFRLLLVFASFVVPYLAFLLILPGVREKRLASFVAITIQIGVGLLIMASLILPYWKVGEVTMVSQFYSHSRLRHEAHLGVNVGLECINITLNYLNTVNTAEIPFRGLYLNERYYMSGVGAMSEELRAAYRRGLPYPLLKVMEYFSLSQGAFAWGRLYRNAGYYTNAVLWLSFVCWALQCVMLALVPHHYSKTGLLCGILALLSNCVYVGNTPASDVKIPFETREGDTVFLLLYYGSCIYMSFFAGLIAITFGLVLSILQFLRLYSISTCLSGYLDDTVAPKCKWSQNTERSQRRILPIEMKSVPKSLPEDGTASSNGWTTLNSSATASTAASSTSSTNGDHIETYITDETASAGDMTPAKRTRPPMELLDYRQRVTEPPDSPDSGVVGSSQRQARTTSTSAADLYHRRQNNSDATMKLSSHNSPPHHSTLMGFAKGSSSSAATITPALSQTANIGISPVGVIAGGESSGIPSSRSSFSDCSLAGGDDDESASTTRRNSLTTGRPFFNFTDDEGDDDRSVSKRKNKRKDCSSNRDNLFNPHFH